MKRSQNFCLLKAPNWSRIHITITPFCLVSMFEFFEPFPKSFKAKNKILFFVMLIFWSCFSTKNNKELVKQIEIENSCGIESRESKEYLISFVDSCYYFLYQRNSNANTKYIIEGVLKNDQPILIWGHDTLKNGDVLPYNEKIKIVFSNKLKFSSEIKFITTNSNLKISFFHYYKVVSPAELLENERGSKDSFDLEIKHKNKYNGLILFPSGSTTVLIYIYNKENILLQQKDFVSERPILDIANFEKGEYFVRINIRGQDYFYSFKIN